MMESFKQFIIEGRCYEDMTHEQTPVKGMPPALITLKRLSVRNYTANTWIALYQSQQLDRHFTVLYQ